MRSVSEFMEDRKACLIEGAITQTEYLNVFIDEATARNAQDIELMCQLLPEDQVANMLSRLQEIRDGGYSWWEYSVGAYDPELIAKAKREYPTKLRYADDTIRACFGRLDYIQLPSEYMQSLNEMLSTGIIFQVEYINGLIHHAAYSTTSEIEVMCELIRKDQIRMALPQSISPTANKRFASALGIVNKACGLGRRLIARGS